MTLVVKGLSANGTTTPIEFTAEPTNKHLRQERTVFLLGDFGGGNIIMEASPDPEGSTEDRWAPIQDVVAQTSPNVFNIRIRCHRIRFVLAGATAPDIDIYLDTAPSE